MPSPLVSVVIPAYNQANFLSEAIESVLDQTYSNLEVVVVNDASSDHTEQVAEKFDDPRVKYVAHKKNRGLPAARNTGMRVSSGQIIALLDSDDYFHPQKLETHVSFLGDHPQIGVSYNARFDLNHSAKTIRQLWRPPLVVGLKELVLGFPFSPSDMVIRRDWAFKVDLFDESYVCGGEDTDLPCRLALAGCQFASVDRALNYRRYHSGRRKNLPCRLDDITRTLNATFNDPRCPQEVLAVQDTAILHHLLVLTYLAFAQDETSLAQHYVRQVVRIAPEYLAGNPCELIKHLLADSIADENLNHEELLKKIFAQMPSELVWLSSQYDWAAAQGFLFKGVRAIMWDRPTDGQAHFAHAVELAAKTDEEFLRYLTDQLLSYEKEFGPAATQEVLQKLAPHLTKIGTRSSLRWLQGCYAINRAFRDYKSGQYAKVLANILKAISNNLSYLTNRGVISVFIQSLLGLMRAEKLQTYEPK